MALNINNALVCNYVTIEWDNGTKNEFTLDANASFGFDAIGGTGLDTYKSRGGKPNCVYSTITEATRMKIGLNSATMNLLIMAKVSGLIGSGASIQTIYIEVANSASPGMISSDFRLEVGQNPVVMDAQNFKTDSKAGATNDIIVKGTILNFEAFAAQFPEFTI